MKRGNIRRYTRIKAYAPLKPGTKRLKRTRLKPVSKAEGKRRRENKPLLDVYRAEFTICEHCGRNAACDIHEIVGGPVRLVARGLRSCILHLCRLCHEALQAAPKRVALATKLASDPVGFNLSETLSVWGRAATAILIDELIPLMPKDLPSVADARLTREHWARKVELLRRQLSDAEVKLQAAVVSEQKATVRESKIRESRTLTKE